MESFKDWIRQGKHYINVDTPIHFKLPDIKKYITVGFPVHFKRLENSKSESDLKEENETSNSLKDLHLLNVDLHGDDGLSKIFGTQYNDHISPTDRSHLRRYTVEGDNFSGSYDLNRNLAKGRPLSSLSERDRDIHKAIMENSIPSKHTVHLFSGVTRDFEDMSKRHGSNFFHFPAHTSMTHDANTAMQFAVNKYNNSRDNPAFKHIMHLHVKIGDHILPVENISDHPDEHEVIIPAGTKMKYHGSTVTTVPFKRSWEYDPSDHLTKIHHFTVDNEG